MTWLWLCFVSQPTRNQFEYPCVGISTAKVKWTWLADNYSILNIRTCGVGFQCQWNNPTTKKPPNKSIFQIQSRFQGCFFDTGGKRHTSNDKDLDLMSVSNSVLSAVFRRHRKRKPMSNPLTYMIVLLFRGTSPSSTSGSGGIAILTGTFSSQAVCLVRIVILVIEFDNYFTTIATNCFF